MERDLFKTVKAVHPQIQKWITLLEIAPQRVPHHFAEWSFSTNAENQAFWPASTIKLYAVVAAFEFFHSRQLPDDTVVVFQSRTESGNLRVETSRTLLEMVSEIFRRSSNEDYSLLLRMLGVDYINAEFLCARKGFTQSAIMRHYVRHAPIRFHNSETQEILFLYLDSQGKPVTRQHSHRWSGEPYSSNRGAKVFCPETGNCTTTAELAHCLRRLVYHNIIPEEDRFNISEYQHNLLVYGHTERGLYGLENREAGPYVWTDCAQKLFPEARYYHKSGRISEFVSDLCCIVDRSSGTEIILSIAVEGNDPSVVRDVAFALLEHRKSQGHLLL